MLILGVAGCAGRSPVVPYDDATISEAVRVRLATDDQTKPFAIAVGTTAGVVHVSGSVATSADRDAVERITRETTGVRSVDNYVRFGGVPVPAEASSQ